MLKMPVQAVRAAIDQSILRDESVVVEVEDIEKALDTLSEMWDGDIDYVMDVGTLTDGRTYTDVWGWNEDTPAHEQDWRIYLVGPAGQNLKG